MSFPPLSRFLVLTTLAAAATPGGGPAEALRNSAGALPVSGPVMEGAARPGEQIDAPGRRSAWLGTETGDFEAWVYPLKVIRGLELRFTFRDRTWQGHELARHVEVRPEWSAITYAHEAFRVRQVLAAPLDQPALLMLLEVESSFEIQLEVAFHIDLQPMWPAGLGGQYSYWDAEIPGFVLGEGSGRNLALVASPAAVDPTIQPAHSLPDQPTRFALRVAPGEAVRLPVVVAAWTEGMEGPRGLAGLRERYAELVEAPLAPLAANAEHYRRVLHDTVQIATPEPTLDEAFAWAKVRLDQGLVCNPHLGCGLVAGYGRARAGYRPGFAWFFGGDALYNSWALGALGAHSTVAPTLEFLARYQREDGKIMHELSQGAGTLDWFEDYPYGFYHAEGSPYFIDAVARHVRATGDLEWGRRLMPAVRRAYAYSLSADTDGDGLMENTIAGLGAVEMGALREAAVHQDLYLVSIWTKALESLAWLARRLDEPGLADQAADGFDRARESLDRLYWMEDDGYHAFGTTTDGGRLEELTLWSILPASLALSGADTGARNVATVAAPAVTTDWGTRMLASTSELYDPLIYNQGTVWPFLSGFAGLAAWEYGNPWAGLDLLHGLAALSRDHARGAMHEVLSGDRYEPMRPSVPHQLFSTSSLVTPLVRGLFGLDVDAVANRVTLRPLLPARWPGARIGNVAVPGGRVTFEIAQSDGSLSIAARYDGRRPAPQLRLEPALPPGATDVRVRVDGGGPAPPAEFGRRGPFPTASVELEASSSRRVEWRWSGGVPVAFEGPRAAAAAASTALRVTEGTLTEAGTLRLILAGRAGEAYRLLSPAPLQARRLQGLTLPGAEAASNVRLRPLADGWELTLEGGAGYLGAEIELARADTRDSR